MQTPQRIHKPLHTLHIPPSHQPHNLLLHPFLTVQKLLNKLPIHKPKRLLPLTHHALKSAILVEGHVARGFDVGGDTGLQAHEEVLVGRVDEAEEVDGAFDLFGG